MSELFDMKRIRSMVPGEPPFETDEGRISELETALAESGALVISHEGHIARLEGELAQSRLSAKAWKDACKSREQTINTVMEVLRQHPDWKRLMVATVEATAEQLRSEYEIAKLTRLYGGKPSGNVEEES